MAGDPRALKVHVHNERPDLVIGYGLTLGSLSRISVENLDNQARDVRETRAEAFTAEPAGAAAGGRRGHRRRRAVAPTLALGVIAVVSGDGLAAIFRDFGVAAVVHGGQTSNPSTGELLEAVAAVDAREVLILPNNPNVVLAARQVAALADRPVAVVASRNAAEGFAALLALDPTLGAEANCGPMTEAARAIQTVVVTEAVRDAAIGGRKVKRGQTIALDPDDGLIAVDGDRVEGGPRRDRGAASGLRAPDDLLRRRRGPRRGRGDGEAHRCPGARDRRGGPPRRPALLPVPDLGGVGVAKATSPVPPPPADPVELLDTPLARSGLAAGATLRRAGIRLGVYDVRDLLFFLPRRYDDLREMHRLGDLGLVEPGTVVSARVRVADVKVLPSFRRRVQRTVAVLTDQTGTIEATWFGRRYIERRLQVDQEVVVSGRVKWFGRKLTLDNPEFQAVQGDDEVLHAGRIVPVYRLTAGLTAARLRSAIRDALDRAGPTYPEYLPAAIRAEMALPGIPATLESAHYPLTFEAAMPPSAGSPSTSSWRSSSAWSPVAASGPAPRPSRSPSTMRRTPTSGRPSPTRWPRGWGGT